MKKSVIFVLLILYCHALFGADEAVTFREMDFNIGARAQGMAGAFTSVADDSSAVFWNPAGLAKIKTTDLSLSFNSWFVDTSIQYLTGAIKTEKNGGVGFGLVYVNMGEIDYIDDDGFLSGSTLRPFSLIATCGYGTRTFDYYGEVMKVNPEVSLDLGLAFKIIIGSDGLDLTHGIFLDSGLLLSFGNNVKAGLSVQNLGAVSYGIAPVTGALGLSVKLLDDSFNIINSSVDVKYGAEKVLEISGGLEYSFAGNLFLRGGYQWQDNYKTSEGSISGVSAGFGIRLQSLMFDYSFAFNGGLGMNHILSLRYMFKENNKTR